MDIRRVTKEKYAVDLKWIYKINFKPNDEVKQYKARLVACSFKQIKVVDFNEIFGQVTKIVTLRCLLAMAVKRNSLVHQ